MAGEDVGIRRQNLKEKESRWSPGNLILLFQKEVSEKATGKWRMKGNRLSVWRLSGYSQDSWPDSMIHLLLTVRLTSHCFTLLWSGFPSQVTGTGLWCLLHCFSEKKNPQELLYHHGDRSYYEVKFWKFRIFLVYKSQFSLLKSIVHLTFVWLCHIGKK